MSTVPPCRLGAFQHTAARRRLGHLDYRNTADERFNTQPPEGGWSFTYTQTMPSAKFQHTAARRRLEHCKAFPLTAVWFQHTAARRRLGPSERAVFLFDLFQHTAARRRLEDQY